MKKLVISALLAVLVILSAGIAKAEEKEPGEESFKPPKVLDSEKRFSRERLSARQRDRRNRRNRSKEFRGQLQKLDEGIRIRQGEHKKLIDELASIKKLAIKEKAEKTAERIETLIEAKNAEFAESIKELNKSRDRFRESLTLPGSRPAEEQTTLQPEQAKQAEQEDNEDAKKGKGKWWQFWK